MKTILHPNLRENLEMLRAAMRRPKEVATIFPTSSALSSAILAGHDFKSAKRVVELGPGTGAITRPLRKHLAKDTDYIGIELDEGLASSLARRFPDMDFVQDSAEKLPRIL